MLKYLFAFIMLMHGLIHFMGFAKAFGYGNLPQLTKEILKPVGMVWFLTAVLFLAASILFIVKNESWPVVGIIALGISQLLIVASWQDARFGTVANIIILVVAILALAENKFN